MQGGMNTVIDRLVSMINLMWCDYYGVIDVDVDGIECYLIFHAFIEDSKCLFGSKKLNFSTR